LLLALLALACLALPLSSARAADFGIEPGSFKARMLDADGNQESGAGSHPDRLQIDFALSLEGSETTPRDLVFDLPPGFAGNPGAVLDCPRALFEKDEEECPAESQVGLLRFSLLGGAEIELPIFKLEPKADEVIAFGSRPGVGLSFSMELRPDDFGITLRAPDLAEVAITEGHAELWGVPADRQQGTAIPRRPFLTAPTRCGPLPFTFHTRSWQEGAPWLSADAEAEAPLVGCEDLAFRPKLDLQLDNPIADAPAGLQTQLSTPPEEDGSTRADSQIKDVTIELPDGVTISPGGAQALAACSDAQLALGSSEPARCPAASQVGTAEVVLPVLPEPVTGALYLGEERPGERFRIFVVAPAPGTTLKFVGAMQVDPLSGRLSTRLTNLPPTPITSLGMSFGGGPGALLATPLSCGPSEAVGTFVPYGGGPPVRSSAFVQIGGRSGWQCPGLGPFSPRLLASSSRPEAGRLSPFTTTLLREEGEQLPRRFSIALPAGLSAALGSLQTCSDAALAANACPLESRVGGVLARFGSGPIPVALPGDVFLTGPYRKAPFGLSMQLRAALGPFDLGTIAFRAQIQMDSRSGRVTVLSDALPATVEGMPVRFRAIELSMDRPGFIRNPTACGPLLVKATIESSSAASAVTSSVPMRGCRRLGFRPRLRIVLQGGATAGEQAMQISARPRRGDTNLRSLKVALPPQLRFDISEVKELCSRYDALAGDCPASSKVGTAKALTGLLDEPLRGAIHLAQPAGRGQPDLWFSLRAMGIDVQLQSRTSIRDGRLITQLQRLPDMPLSALTMRLGSSGRQVISLTGGLCRHGHPRRLESSVRVTGQNGSRRGMRLPVAVRARCR